MTIHENGMPDVGIPFSFAIRDSIDRELDRYLTQRLASGPAQAIARIHAAMGSRDLDEALRQIDRAWRNLSAHSALLAPLYGRLLCLEAKDHSAALQVLRCAAEFSSDPEVTALIVVCLLRLHRYPEAKGEFAAALTLFCVEPNDLLAQAGREMLLNAESEEVGWIGLGAHLQVIGQLSPRHPTDELEVLIDRRAPFVKRLFTTRNQSQTFTIAAHRPLDTSIRVSSHGAFLLGNGLLGSEGFSLDGRAAGQGRRIEGWVHLGWRPHRPVKLRAEDEAGRCVDIPNRADLQPGWRWHFSLAVGATPLRGHRLFIAAQLPDGQWQRLPDAPLLLPPAVRLPRSHTRPLDSWKSRPARVRRAPGGLDRAPPIDVIIPVYRGREETLACIQSVLATIDDTASLIVVDDASDDPVLRESLDTLAAEGRIRLLRNAVNQGFVLSVNRALRLNPTRDVLLLNSDTLVFEDWLPRLRSAAYSGGKVGTVTPLSNSGSIASYPKSSGGATDPRTAARTHALTASILAGRTIELPVGVGFCLFVRRDCLLDVGELDASAFGKGYGEETDFCLRARARGWSHRLAADVFVYHSGGVSFAARRNALLERSQRLLNLRHPGFDAFIADFIAQDPLRSVRRQLDEQRLLESGHRIVLIVTLALTGGVDRYVQQRCRELTAQGLFPLLLRPAGAGDSSRCQLSSDAMELPNLRYDIPRELSALISLLRGVTLDSIEIQHFLDLDSRIIDAVRGLAAPYDTVIHDYSWICPRVTLIDGSLQYCGEPAVAVCRECVRCHGSKLHEKISVPALRARSAAWLEGARRVTVPSIDAAQRMRRYFPDVTFDVQPHGAAAVAPLPVRRAARDVLRVALIGAIGTHKGYRVLLECARDARSRKLPIEYVVIGHTELDAPLLATGKVFVTGRYSESEAPHLIRRQDPDIALMPSVWPETWCYTLDLALDAGLPVVAFDLGAIAERLRVLQHGELLPLGLPARQISDRLLALGRRMQDSDLTKSIFFPSTVSYARDDAKMRKNNDGGILMMKPASGSKPTNGSKSMNGLKSGIGTKSLNGAKAAQGPKPATDAKTAKREVQPEIQDGLSASVQVLPLPAGLYLFSVKSAVRSSTPASGQLALPAMHVGLGPGVRSDQVEFIAGPSTHGAWLFSAGDLLVTKISGTGVTMVLTSVRAPGGDVLSISVERLDLRAETKGQSAPSTEPTLAELNGAGLGNGSGNGKEVAKDSLAGPSVFKAADSKLPLAVEIGAHIRTRGDMNFANVPWAGRVAPGLWIESFAVRPLEQFGLNDIEYKGLTGSGFETPWLSDGKMCGTKGMATPLVGFAIRLKPSPTAAGFDCEYSGYFQSGIVIGPLRNGAPCRSSVANDSLEGIQVRLVKRSNLAVPEAQRKAGGSFAKPEPRSSDESPAAASKKSNSTDGRAAAGAAPRREPARRT